MAERPGPWLSIIGIGEDGADGLSEASRAALAAAEIVFGGPRHLALARIDARGRPWPVPFSVDAVLACRGQRVAVLASGDPFWFGAGGSLVPHLDVGEWVALPAPSTFSLAAARLGWRLEDTECLGLHAAPFDLMQPLLRPRQRMIATVRDAPAVTALAAYVEAHGCGASRLWVLEALGGPAERVRATTAAAFALDDVSAPVAVAIEVASATERRPDHRPGRSGAGAYDDDAFVHDGQITKRPVRALTLSALMPCAGKRLWDIGAGSGSISIEWCLAGGEAIAIEPRADRAAMIRANVTRFGCAHMVSLIEGRAPEALAGLLPPDAVFVGGGASASLLDLLWDSIPSGCRLVINAVTLETEALVCDAQARRGGALLRIELARAAPLGRMRGWIPSRPVVQWSVER